jgi:hypothetical protein
MIPFKTYEPVSIHESTLLRLVLSKNEANGLPSSRVSNTLLISLSIAYILARAYTITRKNHQNIKRCPKASLGARYGSILSLAQPDDLSTLLNLNFQSKKAEVTYLNNFTTGKISSFDRMIRSDLGAYLPGDLLVKVDIATMAKGSIVFALANPNPEIEPAEAAKYAAVVATGRSDFPNQINNVLAFPGFFRGLLDAGAHKITETMLLAAAGALADCVEAKELNASYIVPSVFHPDVATRVAEAVRKAARK